MSVELTKLPSGLTVVTDTMPHLETAALGVWTGVGGRDEKANEHGISHLLEHMAFKGTKKRSSREIVEEIEAVGGDLNAGTSTETTAYYARVMKADVPLALGCFNLGVELGQIAFVLAIGSLVLAARRSRVRLPHWLPWGAAYALGTLAAFWAVERSMSFV